MTCWKAIYQDNPDLTFEHWKNGDVLFITNTGGETSTNNLDTSIN